MTPPQPPPRSPGLPPRPPPPPVPALSAERAARAEATFNSALERSAGERAAFVAEACGEDGELQAHVRELLAAHGRAEGFVKSAAPLSPEVEEQLARLKPEEGGEMIGPYKLLQQIGEGGFGVVWMAEQERPVRRRVALKIIKIGMDTKEVIARFGQERQALAMMDHPNIAKVLDAGATPVGRPFFVMELVRGVKITEYCDSQRLSTGERIELFIRVCHAVQHAHQKGIIHRDLKPSNILVSINDGEAVPKVIDFGVAKATQGRLTDGTLFTQFEQMVGTPLYMSPEQAEFTSLNIDTRSDIYSLGVILYELLTGRTPLDREKLMSRSREEMVREICQHEPVRPSVALTMMAAPVQRQIAEYQRSEVAELIDRVRGDLDWIVMKSLAKERDRRYDTAKGLAMDIRRHLDHQPVLARPPSKAYRMRRFVRRHRTGVAATAVTGIALLFGAAISTWQALRVTAVLGELSKTAPAFATQAKMFTLEQKYDDAIQSLSNAIRLQPKAPAFRYERAVLLAGREKFPEAANEFREVLRLRPLDVRAKENAEFCERLDAVPREPDGKLPRETRVQLLQTLLAQGRPASELVGLSEDIGQDDAIMEQHCREVLRNLPVPSDPPLEQRVKRSAAGGIELDLSNSTIADLRPLRSLRLASLDLRQCKNVSSIEELRGMKLRKLQLGNSSVASLEPVAGMATLEELDISSTAIEKLDALQGLALRVLVASHSRISSLDPLADTRSLEKLAAAHTRIDRLDALRGMEKLRHLEIGETLVRNLEPLRTTTGLETLECSYINTTDFTPLARLPIEQLALQGATKVDLNFTRTLSRLKLLVLTAAREVKDFASLREVSTLEVLVLPGNPLRLPEPERAAIESLRDHPKLTNISFRLPVGADARSAEDAKEFWREWERTMRWWQVLVAAGVQPNVMPHTDGWQVQVRDPDFEDLSAFTGSNVTALYLDGCPRLHDLTPLRDSQLRTLAIGRTAVDDLSSLAGLKLEELWMARTGVDDLKPLLGMPLKVLYANDCPKLRDVSTLAELRSLERVLLPECAENIEALQSLPNLQRISFTYDAKRNQPACDAKHFWREWRDLKWLRSLRTANVAVEAEQLSDGTWRLAVKDAAFSDLTRLAGARISVLWLQGTKTSELAPLAALPLRVLRLDSTPCKDVSPLAAIPTLESLVLPHGVAGIEKLQALSALKRLAFEVSENGEPASPADVFWRDFSRERQAR